MKKNIVIGLFVTTLFVQYGLAMQENVKAEKEVVKTNIAEPVTEEEKKCVEEIVEKVLIQIDNEKSVIRLFLKQFYAGTIELVSSGVMLDKEGGKKLQYATQYFTIFLRLFRVNEKLTFSRVLEALYEKANILDEKEFKASSLCRFTNFIRFVYFTYTEQCLKTEKDFFNLHEENLYQI